MENDSGSRARVDRQGLRSGGVSAAPGSAFDAIVLTEPASHSIVEVNDSFCALTGYEREQLIGRTPVEIGLVPADASDAETTWISGQRPGGMHATRLRHRDGAIRLVEFTPQLVTGDGLVLLVARDARVIEPDMFDDGYEDWAQTVEADDLPAMESLIKKAIDKRLEADAARFFDLASDMVCTTSFDGWFEQLNERWEQILGWSKEELRSRPVLDFVHVDDRLDTALHLEDFGQDGETVNFVNRVATKDGRWRWLEWTSTRVRDERMVYAAARDVTARVAAEEAIRKAEAEASEARDQALAASRSKSAFLANMSHEVRTPLNGVIGMADLLLDSQLDDQQRDNARLLKSAGETLAALVDDILDFSKIEAGALRLEHVDFDLIEMVEDACDLNAERAQQKGVELTLHLAPELTTIVRGDVIRVRQVLTNLLSNAVKFTDEGEVRVAVTTCPASDGSTRIRFEVTDTGIGIDEARLAHLWEPFVQADDSTTRRFGGTGLGLAIVRQLVEMMDGRGREPTASRAVAAHSGSRCRSNRATSPPTATHAALPSLEPGCSSWRPMTRTAD